MRVIMLVDMDYFFVACEEIKRPELKNKPTIVGSDPKGGKGRGVVMTCNYEARKYGIHSAMPISMAYKLKPDANYLPVDFSYYEEKSREVVKILKEYAGKLEQVSIDEAFMDVSDKVKDYDEALRHAEEIKKAVKNRAKLPCSIGISYNKLMAKMACEKAKPNGIKVIKEEDAREFLEKMHPDDLYGVGKKTREKLESLGYKTVGELAKANVMNLRDKLGSMGIELHNYANGIDDSEVLENYETKSISRERTFEFDTTDSEKVKEKITELSKEVFEDASRMNYSFKVITIKMRYGDFTETLKSKSIRPSNELDPIVITAKELYDKYADKKKKLRKIGVRISGLTGYKSQRRLFN